jgi:Concanavalin A-like lectin/glucanases superfamily/Lamin Tail Domain/Secretion system C-terminal sorting domain
MKKLLLVCFVLLLSNSFLKAQLITFDDQGHVNGASYGNPYNIVNGSETFVFTVSGGAPTSHVYRTTESFCSNTGFSYIDAGPSSQTTWTIEVQSGNEVNFGNITFANVFTCFAFTYNLSIEGFKNGASTGTQAFAVNPGFSNVFNSNASFDDVDKIVITCADLANLGIDNINWVSLVPPCTDPTVPTVTYTPSTVCNGNNATLNISGTLNDATAWQVYTGSCGGTNIGFTTTGTFPILGTITSPTTYYVRGEGGCVTPGSCGTVTITPTALDDASFNYSALSYCVNDSDPTPTITGLGGGTFSSTAGLSINASTGAIDVSASTPNTYTVTYTTSGSCPNSSNVSVTINALDNASFNYSAASYCVNASDPTPTITGLTGGTFSSTAGLSINASTGAIDVSASTPNTYTVTYTTAGTCPNSSNVSVTINALDNAGFNYGAASYCVNASDPTPTITGLAGGSFSSTAGLSINASTGNIDVSASTPGTYTVTYTTAGSCPNSSAVSVTINALDDASFSYGASSYTTIGSDPTPTITGLAGGTFSSSPAGLSLNTTTGSIDLSASTPNTYTVTYTTAGACPNSSNVNVSITTGVIADLVITEIMYNTPGVDIAEFIEIYNNGSSSVDLTNYSFSQGVTYTFPSVSLNAGEYFVITMNAIDFNNVYGFAPDAEWTSGNLVNTSESITIIDSFGNTVDSVNYDDGAPNWPTGTDGQGASIILCDPNTDNNDGSNWKACTNNNGVVISGTPVFASPGVANFCCPILTGIDLQTTCDSLVWIDGNTYYSDNNTATFTIQNGSGCDSTVTLNLTVKASPTDQTLSASQNTFCVGGGSTTIDLTSSEVGVDYFLRDNSNDMIVDGPVTGTGSGISLNTGTITSTTTYNVYAQSYDPTTVNALSFTGNSGLKKVSLGTAIWDDNFVGQNQLTVEAWVNRSATGSLHTIIGNYQGSYPFLFRIDNDKITFFMNSTASVPGSTTIPVGTWTHVAATYDGTTIKVYVNGVLDGSGSYSSTFIATANEVKIGGGLSNNTEYFPGDIADVRLWNVAKTEAEIAAMKDKVLMGTESGLVANYQFTEGLGTTTANSVIGNSYPGTLVNSPAWVSGPILSSASCSTEMTQTATVSVLTALTGTDNTTICANESVVVNGTTYDAATPNGIEVFTNVGPNGCDSTVTVALNVLPALIGSVNNTICNNESVVINGTTYDAATPNGIEVFTNVGPNGCDSTVTVALNVLPALTGSVNNTICANESVVINGTTYDANNPIGTEVITGVGPNNCDSTVTINLNVLPALTGSVTNTICNNESVVVNGTIYDTNNPTGTEVFTNVGPNNCDSTVTVALNVEAAIDVTIDNSGMPTLSANQTGASYQWLDCDNGNAIIPTETNQSFTATVNGNYAVEITVGSCVDTSACENITGVGIKEAATNVVSIYPNPTSGLFTIDLGNNGELVNYTITTIEGRIVEANRTTQNKVNIDLTDESKGVYFLLVQENNTTTTYKIIKQ